MAPILYPGVKETFSQLDTRKIMVTRNLQELAEPYARMLGFDTIFSEVRDKYWAAEEYLGEALVIGDSEEDSGMAKNSRASIYICEKPEDYNPLFTIGIGRDWTGLARILQNAKDDSNN